VLHAVIMAGGSGTRFWPESRRGHPKQFLRLAGDRTLIQATADRCAALVPPARRWIVTNVSHAAETARQLPDQRPDQILQEPCGRNTAPCIGLAALQVLAVDPDAVMLVLPADHIIATDEQFRLAVEAAVDIVCSEPQSLVLFGVKPTYPATGFGYMLRGEPLRRLPVPAYRVERFREKPDRETAQRYLADGNHYWNCGIFVWRAQAILDALRTFAPDIHARLERLRTSVGAANWSGVLSEEFPRMPSISIDYAVLERADDVCVLEAPFTWDDVGSWQALTRWRPQDPQGNTVDGLFCGVKSEHNIIRSGSEHLIAAYGVHDLIIVHTPNATLVADRHDENALRELTAELERRGLTEFL
jgi:mannose-1-phosphate guanylyltransferase